MSTSKAEGRREDALAKQRSQMREEFERQKQTLINETEKSRPSSNRFVGQHDSMEESLKNSTVGLVRLEDFQQRRKELEEAKAREAARTSDLKYVSYFYILTSFCFSIIVKGQMAYRLWRICLGMTQRRN
jgi:protein FAM50